MKSRRTSFGPPSALLCLVPILSGCGFIFTQGPPQNHQSMPYFSCTESNTGPILDIVWGSLNVIGALAIAGDQDSYEDPGTAIAGGLIWGGVSAAAAGVGFGKTRRCREAQQQLLARLGPAAPQPGLTEASSAVQAVVISPTQSTVTVGGQAQLIATAHSSSGASVPGQTFAWSSSNDAIASVGAAGLVTAHAPGSVVIAVRAGSVVGTATVTVAPR